MRITLVLTLVIGCARPAVAPPVLTNVAHEPFPEPPIPDPPATCKPPCEAAGATYRPRLAALECKVACLKEHAWRTKPRLALSRI